MKCFNRALFFLSGMAVVMGGVLAQAEPVKLRFPLECTLKVVAERKNVKLRGDVAVPSMFFESSTSFEVFKKDVQAQGHDFPKEFSNAYVYVGGRNNIYLIDDPAYYARHGRFIDDSLAHELVHFLQVRYQRYDLSVDEFAELEAVDMQTWFRETYLIPPDAPSPCDGIK